MIEQIPVTVEPIQLNDFALGVFTALALRRGRIDKILGKALPGDRK